MITALPPRLALAPTLQPFSLAAAAISVHSIWTMDQAGSPLGFAVFPSLGRGILSRKTKKQQTGMMISMTTFG